MVHRLPFNSSSTPSSPSPTVSAPSVTCPSLVPNLSDTLSAPSLPPFDLPADPSFTWGIHSGHECVQLILKCYDEAIHWKANLFKIPNGKAGENFIKELSRLFRSYAEAHLLNVLLSQLPFSSLF